MVGLKVTPNFIANINSEFLGADQNTGLTSGILSQTIDEVDYFTIDTTDIAPWNTFVNPTYEVQFRSNRLYANVVSNITTEILTRSSVTGDVNVDSDLTNEILFRADLEASNSQAQAELTGGLATEILLRSDVTGDVTINTDLTNQILARSSVDVDATTGGLLTNQPLLRSSVTQSANVDAILDIELLFNSGISTSVTTNASLTKQSLLRASALLEAKNNVDFAVARFFNANVVASANITDAFLSRFNFSSNTGGLELQQVSIGEQFTETIKIESNDEQFGNVESITVQPSTSFTTITITQVSNNEVEISGYYPSDIFDDNLYKYVPKGKSDKTQSTVRVKSINNIPRDADIYLFQADDSIDQNFTYRVSIETDTGITAERDFSQRVLNDWTERRDFLRKRFGT